MKRLKMFLLFLLIVFYSAGQGIPKNSKVAMKKGKGVLLEYVGSITGMMNLGMGIQVEIDTTIGIRYEVTFEKGNKVLSHIAMFYKFSAPGTTIFYNFLTHKSFPNDRSGSIDTDPKVVVIGQETMENYSCTHLQHAVRANPSSITDYWMSSQLPGFSQIMNALNAINSSFPSLAIGGTVFMWGGLVRMKGVFTDAKRGTSETADLNLQEAQTGMNFASKDFDVPTK